WALGDTLLAAGGIADRDEPIGSVVLVVFDRRDQIDTPHLPRLRLPDHHPVGSTGDQTLRETGVRRWDKLPHAVRGQKERVRLSNILPIPVITVITGFVRLFLSCGLSHPVRSRYLRRLLQSADLDQFGPYAGDVGLTDL